MNQVGKPDTNIEGPPNILVGGLAPNLWGEWLVLYLIICFFALCLTGISLEGWFTREDEDVKRRIIEAYVFFQALFAVGGSVIVALVVKDADEVTTVVSPPPSG